MLVKVNPTDQLAYVLLGEVVRSPLRVNAGLDAIALVVRVVLKPCPAHLDAPLAFALRFKRHVLNSIDPPVDKFFLRQKTLENDFSILKVKPMEIFGFHFFLI